jgi:hypothetical protein
MPCTSSRHDIPPFVFLPMRPPECRTPWGFVRRVLVNTQTRVDPLDESTTLETYYL